MKKDTKNGAPEKLFDPSYFVMALTNSYKRLYLMHSTSLSKVLKEFREQNVQDFVASASAQFFGKRPNLKKNENFGFGPMSKIRLWSYTVWWEGKRSKIQKKDAKVDGILF